LQQQKGFVQQVMLVPSSWDNPQAEFHPDQTHSQIGILQFGCKHLPDL